MKKKFPKILPEFPHVHVDDPDHFAAVCGEVMALGLAAEFYQALRNLEDRALEGCHFVLYYDFAPLSFGLNCKEGEKTRWVGGFIFHPGATAPDKSCSIELERIQKPHWSVHT